MIIAACPVIGSVTGPDVIPDDGDLTSCILLNAPHSDWQIIGNIIKEVWLKYSIVLEEQPPLTLILNVSEMHVVAKIKAFLTIETSEGNVALDLVSISHAECSMRHYLTVILDSHDYIEQTVFLYKTAVYNSFSRVLRRSVLKGIALFLGDRF